ncbi:MAG: BCCT family transporter [Actinomycetes bacterium]
MATAHTSPPTREPRVSGSTIAPLVFWPSLAVIGGFVVFAVLAPDAASAVISAVQSGIITSLGWYYVLLIAGFVAFSLWVGLSRFGDIRLGRDDEKPEFGLRSWFAMLFSAGMGIGLVFWGVAEPLNHFASPRPGFEGGEVEAARQAMTQTYLHWGVHAWAIYVVVGLAVAYAVHRRGRPMSIRWALEPLLGDRVKGRLGDVIDVTAVVGTLFGVATSLGFGVAQIAAGLDFVGLVGDGADNVGLQVVLVALITGIATLSVVSGIGKGIKWLSNLNMGLAALVLVFVLVAGPTLFLLREFVQSFGDYFADVLQLTFDVSAFRGEDGETWQAGWTTFYWGWWISWAPFVGVFIARISRGRTVREFVSGVLIVPTLITFLWFSVLGGTALYRELFGQGGLVGDDGSVGTEASLFGMLDGLPGGTIAIGLALLLIVTFFVTSSDSGSLVVDMLASGGNVDPPRWSRVMWATLEGAVAAALLLVGGGGLGALQTASIITALPFSVVMIGMAVATVRAFHREHQAWLRRQRSAELAELTDHVSDRLSDGGGPTGGRTVTVTRT